jgi:hypothetical protein
MAHLMRTGRVRQLPYRRHLWFRAVIGAVVLTLIVDGCNIDKTLRVDDPDVATAGSTQTAQALPVVLAEAIGDFHGAYQGPGNVNESSGQIGYSGLLADEIRSSDTFPTRDEVDARHIQVDNSANLTEFRRLSVARAAADRADLRYSTFGPDSAGHAIVLALSGYSSILFAENYCSGVPISNLTDDGQLQYGDPLTTEAMLQLAASKFDAALQVGEITAAGTALASVGKGRALLDLGQFADAAAAVATVPTDFVYLSESSDNTTDENNGVWTFFQNVRRLTIPDKEGTNGLDYISSNDPRLPLNANTGKKGFDKTTPYVEQLKYPARSSAVPIATGVEARLIEAEAALQASDLTTFRAKINEARAQLGVPDLPPDSVGATLDDQVNVLFRERAFDMWLTSHRLGDLRRLVRQYGRDAESVFPSGTWFKNNTPYGTDVNFPVPKDEENNPKFTGCLDRNA